jgi:hypothetical protein
MRPPDPVPAFDPHGAGAGPLAEELCAFFAGEELR